MEKEVLSTVVLTTIIANVFTYQSFRYYHKPPSSSKSGMGSDAIVVFPLVSLYVVLYSMLILLSGKWAVDICHMTFAFDKQWIQSVITQSIQASFQSALRMIPFSTFLGVMSFFFEKNLMFTPTAKFSPYYLAFVFVVNVCVMFMYRANPIELSDQNIVSYFITFVTIVSLFKVNQPTMDTKSASNSLDRFVNYCLNLFLNFNMKIVYVMMPFILFFATAFFMITGTTFEQFLRFSVIAIAIISAFIVVAVVHGAVKKHQRKSESGRNAATNVRKASTVVSDAFSTVFNPSVLRPFMKTSLYLALYSLPLALYVYFTSNDFSILKDKYTNTFNREFFEILAFCYTSTAVLQKFVTISQEQINTFVTLQIVFALLLSNR